VTLLNRLMASLRRPTLESELDEELRFHLDMETAENLRRGMSAEEARRAARRSFGGVEVTKDAWRDRRFLPELEAWGRDLRHAARSLARTPAFTAFAAVTLALGIGANTAIFSALHALVLRPLPYAEPARLATVWERSVFQGQPTSMALSAPNLLDWREQNQVFDGIGAFSLTGVNLTERSETLRLPAAFVEPETFRILGVKPPLGRVFLADENQAGHNRVAILSRGLWQRQFGADPNIVGRTIGVNGVSHVVVGVMPADFQFPPRTETQLWTPLGFDEHARAARGSHWLAAIARLKPGITWAAAQSNLDGIALRIARQNGRTDGASVQPLHGETVRRTAEMLTVLSVAVGFILLLACANVSNLILARAAGQRRELALRTALGAGRWRIVRLLLAEALAVSVLGGGLGMLAARLSLRALLASAAGQLPGGVPVAIDSAALWFCASVTLLAAILAGLAPALRTSRVDIVTALKDAAGSATPAGHRLPSLLMVGEIALTLALVIGATLLVKSLRLLSQADLGFRPERVLTMKIALPRAHYETAGQTAAFYDRLIADLAALPGVNRAGAISALPVESADNRFVFTIAGREPASPGSEPGALARIVSPEYFESFGIPLLRGRWFDATDTRHTSPVAVINRRLAMLYFPNQDPVGQHIALGVREGRDAWMTVIGVVGNHWNGASSDPVPTMIYTPLAQFPWPLSTMSLVARASGEPESISAAARRVVRQIDRDAALFDIKPMERVVSESTTGTRILSRLLALFASLAMILAVVGVYGVMSCQVSRRTHELGIRMALGARRGQVLGGVLGRALVDSLLGILAGMFCAMATSGGLRNYIVGVPATDPWTYTVSAAAILSVALAACFVPAWRASRADPLVALRSE